MLTLFHPQAKERLHRAARESELRRRSMLVQAGAAGYPASGAMKGVGMGGPGPAGAGAGADKAGGKRGRAEMERGPKKSALAPGMTAQGQPRKVARTKNAGAEAGMGMVGGVGVGMPMGPGGYPMGGKVRPSPPSSALCGAALCTGLCAVVVWCALL